MDRVQDELKSARGIYRSALKAAKKQGVNQAILIEAMRIKTIADETEEAMHFRDLGRYLRYLNSPLAQFNLFDDAPTEVSPDARAKHDDWEAHEAGYRAIRAGTPVETAHSRRQRSRAGLVAGVERGATRSPPTCWPATQPSR